MTKLRKFSATLGGMLLGVAWGGLAQASVVLYGIVDTGLNYQKRSGKTSVGVDSGLMSNSRWGLRGSEDLSDGRRVTFLLESGFSSDNGQRASSSTFFNRFSLLGLEDKRLGKITLGRGDVLTPTWIAGTVSPFSLNFKTASLGTTFGYNDAHMAGGRVSDAVYYYSPELRGWQLGAGYSWNMYGAEGQFDDESRMLDLALKYEGGRLRGVFGYSVIDSPLQSKKDRTFVVGARYRFDGFNLHAGYQKVRDISIVNGYNGALASRGQFSGDVAWTAGVSIPIGASLLYAGYQHAVDSRARGAAVALTYPLSRRTNLYTYFSRAQSWDFDNGHSLPVTQLALGIRHRF